MNSKKRKLKEGVDFTKKMILREVWFWIIAVGIIVLAVGILIVAFTDSNETLGYITIAGGGVVLIAGIFYAVLKASRKPIDVGEEDIKLRNQFTNTLGGTVQQFNTNVDSQMKDFIGGSKFEGLIKENVKSQGRLVGSVAGAAGKLVF